MMDGVLVHFLVDMFVMKILSEILSPLPILSREITFKKNATLEIILTHCGIVFCCIAA